jgi:hypothetical protein
MLATSTCQFLLDANGFGYEISATANTYIGLERNRNFGMMDGFCLPDIRAKFSRLTLMALNYSPDHANMERFDPK